MTPFDDELDKDEGERDKAAAALCGELEEAIRVVRWVIKEPWLSPARRAKGETWLVGAEVSLAELRAQLGEAR